MPSDNLERYVGKHEFEIVLQDEEGATTEYVFSLNFEVLETESNTQCIKDQRGYIEPYYIKSEYNYVEQANYEEIVICCEEG